MRRGLWLQRAAFTAICAGFGTIAQADTYPRQPGIDIRHYTFKLDISDTSTEIAAEASVDLRFTQAGITAVALDLASAANGKGMTVRSVTSNGAAVPFAHHAGVLRLTLAKPLHRRRRTALHRHVWRHARERAAIPEEQARRVVRVQRELAQSRPRVAADDRSPVRQGDERVRHHRAVGVSGGRERPAAVRDRSRRRAPGDALETVGPDRVLAECRRHRTLRRPLPRRREGRAALVVGRAPGRCGRADLFRAGAARARVLQRARRTVSVREARQRRRGGAQRRHRARERDLLRRVRSRDRRRPPASSPTRSRTSGSATRSPRPTGTKCG